jgi:hypothetical protein
MKTPIVMIEPITLRNRVEEARASDTWYCTASTITLLSVDGKDAYRCIRQRPQIEFDCGRSDGECL